MGKSYTPLRSPEHVFKSIALTAADPANPNAYRSSCHAFTAYAVRSGQLEPHHEIVLLGMDEDVLHSIVVDGNEILADSLVTLGKMPSEFNSVSGVYHGRLAPGTERSEYINVIARMTLADFQAQYMQHPAPQTKTAPPSPAGP